MAAFKIGILEPTGFSGKAVADLEKVAAVEMFCGSDIRAFIADKTAIFTRLRYHIDDDLIRGAAGLRYICSPTTGLNHVCVTNENIEIISLQGEYDFLSSIRATPEHIFGLTLALLRNYPRAFMNTARASWNRDLYTGYEIYESKVGIVGFGRIGKIVASYFQAFGAKVGYNDALPIEAGAGYTRYDSIGELIENCEIIILAANYTPENEKMIHARYLESMHGKYFVNAARGELVDEVALLREIKKDTFKGVAIDVLANESGDPTLESGGSALLSELLPLCENRNLIVTPHIGGATHTSMRRTEEFITGKLLNRVGLAQNDEGGDEE